MSDLTTKLRQLPRLLNWALVIAAVFFISVLFPTSVKFRYNYTSGQFWAYDDLVAPFDFALRKSPAEMENAERKIRDNFVPFYRLDPRVEQEVLADLQQSFGENLRVAGEQYADVQRYPDRYLRYAQDYVRRIYRRGIVPRDVILDEKGREYVVNLVDGSTVRSATLGSLYTIERAQEALTDSLPYNNLAQSDFLLYVMPETLRPNYLFADSLSARALREELAEVVSTNGIVRRGELIVAENGVINDEIFQTLESFRHAYEEEVMNRFSEAGIYLGKLLLIVLIVGTFIVFLLWEEPTALNRFAETSFFLTWIVGFSFLVYLVQRTDSLSMYMIPFCVVPIVVKNFYSSRVAFLTHVTIVLIATYLAQLSPDFILLQVLAGIIVIVGNTKTRNWSRFFRSILFIVLTYCLAYLAIDLLEGTEWKNINYELYGNFVLSGLLTLLGFPLIPLAERVFGFTSSLTLVDLTDVNHPLLRELALKAPGTFQHSIQVGNLAEAAAGEIGADQLLVKVAALYHDVGKVKAPAYFIENNQGRSPHQDLTPLESAKVIIDHVIEGVKMAKTKRLPQPIIDVIRTHHGTTRVEYFYQQQIQQSSGEPDVDESLFRYPGPRPRTREESILMIADSVEAAARAMRDPSDEKLNKLVERITEGKQKDGQLEDSALTFAELKRVKQVFKQMLKSIHHARIAYSSEEEG